jgi:hypothetical protein
MAKTAFDEFVERQQASDSDVSQIDWNKERGEWLAHLNELYEITEDYLQDYISTGRISCSYTDIELNEENIGSYIARQMILKIGRQQIDFKLIGTLLIGMKGGVDVYGPAGSARFVLVNSLAEGVQSLIRVTVNVAGRTQLPPAPSATPSKDITWKWKIAGRPPEMRFLKLTKESLFETIMAIANA